jgi:hypothetical protein
MTTSVSNDQKVIAVADKEVAQMLAKRFSDNVIALKNDGNKYRVGIPKSKIAVLTEEFAKAGIIVEQDQDDPNTVYFHSYAIA